VFEVDGRIVLALLAGSDRLEESRLAESLGGAVATMADALRVREATGFDVGGVPPFGFGTDVPSFMDESLVTQPSVWAAAGTPLDMFEVETASLVRLSGAEVVRLRA
jgi:prolyl-tRNA editing enzyme YbaK/EbsC (Cys-tRNA(Pro) deacylase)